jgi:predicted TIM-barrel fold metal-dependent hydrolase
MIIVDGQIHIWGANTPERPWPADRRPPHRAEPFSMEEALREMDAAGVDRAVLIPASCEGDRNDLVLAAVRQQPGRFRAMGLLNINAPGARSQISEWKQQPGMLGLRLTFSRQSPEDWLWEECEAAGVPIMLGLTQLDLDPIARAAQRFPDLRLVVDHLGIPKGRKDDHAFTDLHRLLALAKYPSVAVKVSALPHHTTDSYPFRNLHPHLKRVYDAFGPKRMFWGSDLVRLHCPYRQVITMFTEEMPWLSSADLEWIMGRGVCEWIGWAFP